MYSFPKALNCLALKNFPLQMQNVFTCVDINTHKKEV